MKFLKGLLGIIIPIAIGLALALVIKATVVTVARVDGPSMEPNLVNNERLLVWRHAKIKHLSVIVFDAHGEDPSATKANTDYVKRVIGLPGDTVSSSNGNLYVNGKKVNQSFISSYQRTTGTGNWDLQTLSKSWAKHSNSVKVPKGNYFVLGDHRSVSNDGRYWGFVPKNKITGVAKTFFWGTDKTKRNNVNNLGY
ncbi:signal peptidase I [Lentilactobacillus farraginis]|uniref:Signal peptidase I n=1 Tax=Lentilactobacillus farraginis DSM 18382 = JCM 14108 TaxID=1423743 RepID=X0PB00_9LACO|nr:signal peptidase I [Lentilactobacillus farraginis]KRM09837.1 signal peptidase I [Lentilactobacillus farraginis DSM 18382 = JCM 14108]GAF36833.1 signal peptidase I [Lentilactobacillus farraginis DSM 18382 = JCM 14108]